MPPGRRVNLWPRRPSGGVETIDALQLPYRVNPVYRQHATHPGLLTLLVYAMRHRHSHQWIAPLTRLLDQRGHLNRKLRL